MDSSKRIRPQKPRRPGWRKGIKSGILMKYMDEQHSLDQTAIMAIIIPATIFIVILNAIVIAAILGKKRLRKLRNMPLVSLAFADFAVGIFLGPMLLSSEQFPERSYMFVIYLVAEAFCYTASLLNMLVVAVDRWIAIFQPLHYSRYVTPFFVWGMIAVAWIFSFLVAGLRSLGGRKDKRILCVYLGCLGKSITFISCGVFFILTLIIVTMQFKMHLIVRSHRRRIMPLSESHAHLELTTVGNSSQPPANDRIATIGSSHNVEVEYLTELNTKSLKMGPEPSRRRSVIAHIILTKEQTHEGNKTTLSQRTQNETFLAKTNIDENDYLTMIEDILGPNSSRNVSSFGNVARHSINVITPRGHIFEESRILPRRLNNNQQQLPLKRTSAQSLQQRTTNLVSFLYLLFIVMWTPYMIVSLMRVSGNCKNGCFTAAVITKIFMFLNSLLNPFIYAVRMKEFRTVLKAIICRKRR